MAYTSLLREERRQLHGTVGEVLERLHADRPQDVASELADHFTQAEDFPRAFHYHRMAGDQALKVYAHQEALIHYDRALEAGERTDMDDEIWDIYQRRGRALELSGQHDKALTNYKQMEARAKEAGRPGHELRAQVQTAVLYCTPTPVADRNRGLKLAQQTLARARELNDTESEARSLWLHLLLFQYQLDRMNNATEAGEQALQLTRRMEVPELQGYILNDLGGTYALMGHVQRAGEVLAEARTVMENVDNMPMLANVLVNQMQHRAIAGEYQQALELSDEGYQLSESIGDLWGQACSLMYIDLVYAELGNFRRALEAGAQCIRIGEASGFAVPAIVSNSSQAWIKAQLGLLEEAHRHVQEDSIETTGLLGTIAGIPFSVLALVRLKAGDLKGAERAVANALDSLPSDPDSILHPAVLYTRLAQSKLHLAQGEPMESEDIAAVTVEEMKQRGFHLLRTEYLLARAHAQRALGEIDGALACLEEGIDEAEDTGALRPLWQFLKDRADTLTEQGQPDAAAESRRRARSIVEQLVENIKPIALDRSFTQQPQVRDLLNAG